MYKRVGTGGQNGGQSREENSGYRKGGADNGILIGDVQSGCVFSRDGSSLLESALLYHLIDFVRASGPSILSDPHNRKYNRWFI